MMQERGVLIDHATVQRWALKIMPILAAAFRRRQRPIGKSWRMEETYLKVADRWQYPYHEGRTVDFLLTAKRAAAAARRFLERAIALHGEPERITIDKSSANTAAITAYNADHQVAIELHQVKYFNNIVKQDHRATKRILRPMLKLKTHRCARRLIAGLETMHMIGKGQLNCLKGQATSAATQFYSLAF